MVLTLAQCILGFVIDHLWDPARQRAPWHDKLHWWLGRIMIFLSIVVMFLGLKLMFVNLIAYFVFWLWIGIVLLALIGGEFKYGGSAHHHSESEPPFMSSKRMSTFPSDASSAYTPMIEDSFSRSQTDSYYGNNYNSHDSPSSVTSTQHEAPRQQYFGAPRESTFVDEYSRNYRKPTDNQYGARTNVSKPSGGYGRWDNSGPPSSGGSGGPVILQRGDSMYLGN